MDTISNILTILDIPGAAKRVYRELLVHGETTPRLLSERLSMTRPSVYDQVKHLEKYGLVASREIGNKTFVGVTDPKMLKRLLTEKREEIEQNERAFDSIVQNILKQTATDSPRIKFFEGKEAVRRALHDVLWDSKGEVCAFWPYREMLVTLGGEFLVAFNEKRLRQCVRLRTIWPRGKKIEKNLWESRDTGVMRRYLKTKTPVSMGYTIYGGKVIFISSKKECFGFTVTSREFAELIQNQFEVLWCVSAG